MGARVLIVDDVDAIRALVRASLEPHFDVVGEAADGIEAVDRARELRPDVVLLDLNMPRQDGLQAIPRLLAELPDVRICVLSGLSGDVVAAKAFELGAHAFVEKGAALEDLGDVLRGLVADR